MSRATAALISYIAQQTQKGRAVVLDEIIFAKIPNLSESTLTDNMPTAQQIMYRQAVSQTGYVNENAVVYSVTLGTEVGDFDFNYIGLINKESNLLGVAVYTDTIKKTANKNGVQGNAVTRSILLEFNGAQTLTNITIPAETWQIDFTARLANLDEKQRLANLDLYGSAAFINDAFKPTLSGNTLTLAAGVAYIGGLRVNSPKTTKSITPPCKVYIDVCEKGTVTGTHIVENNIIVQPSSNADISDYTDNYGVKHYINYFLTIETNGTIKDNRKLQWLNWNVINSIPKATVTQHGITQLDNSIDSNGENKAATSKAVKTAYAKGVEALNKANTKADSVNPILTTNKWYGDMNTVPDGTLFFAINQSTANQPYYNQSGFDAQAWQFDVGNKKVQMIFYTESDIKVRYNDDGVNWSDWTSFLTGRNLSDAVNNSSNSVPASVAGVKTAYDLANSKVGFASGAANRYAEVFAVNGDYAGLQISRSGTSGNWLARFESLPDRTWKLWNNSDGNGFQQIVKAANGTFAFVDDITKALSSYIENAKKSNAVDSTSTDTVATSRAVKLAYDRGTTALNQANTANNNANGRVSKSGDTMSGHLIIKDGEYSSVRTVNTANQEVRWESAPSSSGEFASIVSWTGSTVNHKIKMPKKSGFAVLDTEFSSSGGANTYVKTDGAGDLNARCFRNTYQDENRIQGAIAFRVNNSSDNYTRYCNSPSAVRNWLGLHAIATRLPTVAELGFTQNINDTGWTKFPNGLIIQWGSRTNTGNITFPIAFNKIFSCISQKEGGGDSAVRNLTNTGATLHGDGKNSWIAIGK